LSLLYQNYTLNSELQENLHHAFLMMPLK
jgi:hypothetical protein